MMNGFSTKPSRLRGTLATFNRDLENLRAMGDPTPRFTGEVCTERGEYRSACLCGKVRLLEAGETVPNCPVCGQAVEWRPQRAIDASMDESRG
jgi:hypothetical protein